MTVVVCRRIKSSDVSAVDGEGRKLYNDANHWDGGEKPADYAAVSAACDTSAWLPYVDRRHTVVVLTNVSWLRKAHELWLAGATPASRPISKLFDDEADAAVERHAAVFATEPWFVRAENVSLKYGVHGCGPYTDVRAVLESIVTAPGDHSPLHALHDGQLRLYLFPWVPINPAREFRVFVHDRRVVAASQQHLYQCFESELDDEDQLTRWAAVLEATCAKVSFAPNYVADVAILADGAGYFIEANPFGAQYSSGSGLFHWLRDADVLHGREERMHVAIAVK